MQFLDITLSADTCSKRDLCLLGHLNFAARVIIPGRTFMAKLICMSTTVKHMWQVVHLNTVCREDIAMWQTLLTQYNGVTMFHEKDATTNIQLQIYTDSSSSTGFGGFNRAAGEYFADSWTNYPPLPANTP